MLSVSVVVAANHLGRLFKLLPLQLLLLLQWLKGFFADAAVSVADHYCYVTTAVVDCCLLLLLC